MSNQSQAARHLNGPIKTLMERKKWSFQEKVVTVNLGSIILTRGMTLTPQLLVYTICPSFVSCYSTLQLSTKPRLANLCLHGLLHPGWGTINGRSIIRLFICLNVLYLPCLPVFVCVGILYKLIFVLRKLWNYAIHVEGFHFDVIPTENALVTHIYAVDRFCGLQNVMSIWK